MSAENPKDRSEDHSAAAYTLLDGMALDEAADIAARHHVSDGGTQPSDAHLHEAKQKAKKFLNDVGTEGLKDLRALTLTMGMPSARKILKQLIDFGIAPDPVKQSLRDAVDRISPEMKEHGCQEITFFNKAKGKEDKIYLVADECDANHDLTAQLNKMAPHIPVARRPEINHHISVLVYIVRSVFAKVVKENESLLKDILRYVPSSERLNINALQVDPRNTTLCFHPHTPRRVGIFVKMSDEVEAELAAEKAATK